MGENYTKRKDELKKHEQEFLIDYYKNKNKLDEETENLPP